MDPAKRGHYETLFWLWRAGLRYGGLIDLGCADGHFSVMLSEDGPARNSAILNVDPQEEYRDSLAAIQAALGGHFRLCVVGERDGVTVEMQRGAHAYWTSTRKAGDRYWAGINDLHAAKSLRVPQRSLDSLVSETSLPGPYLLKMDVQGAEVAALAGGRETLARTDVVVVEILVEDFAPIHQAMVQNDFDLFDLTDLKSSEAGTLAWFYAIYVKSRHRALRPTALWNPSLNELAIKQQGERREIVQNEIWAALDRYRAGEWPALPG
jgi:FkbM family methyltransferase